MKHDPAKAGITTLDLDLPARALHQLADFERLLLEHAVPRGFVARSDAPRVRERHLMDCLRAAACVRVGDRLAYDMGSGAGLPGLVVAIARPDLTVRLVEPRRARVAFLELAIDQLDLENAQALETRIEDVTEPADLCFARAFASLPESWRAALPRLEPGGRLVYFAGALVPAPEALPGARGVEVAETPVLESAGSLIIMTR